ncbi:MAG: DUF2520 domain-containing protein [Deltaproteobacteria bacterium]|nr:DUF2520 domain-containing protein [Deltaproteobacteria bacterium]
MTIALFGAGRVGCALAEGLVAAGQSVSAHWTRSKARAERASQRLAREVAWGDDALPAVVSAANTLIIAVSDDAIRPLANRLSPAAGQIVLHTSGAQSAAVALGSDIAQCGTFHPLCAIADHRQAAGALAGALFALEGADAAVAEGQRLAERLGGVPRRIAAEDLPRYHAGAVLASNLSVALWAAALDVWQPLGIGLDALLPLMRSTLQNLDFLGLPEALTGPVRRGDDQTVARHLALLADRSPALLPVYRQLSLLALRCAESSDRPPDNIERLRALLDV